MKSLIMCGSMKRLTWNVNKIFRNIESNMENGYGD